jgi:hypothetical protein
MEAPAAVSRAISGGEWVADAAEPGLAAQLGDVADDGPHPMENVPAVVPDSEVRVSPHVNPSDPVAMSWTERNPSRADLPGYYTDVYVEGPDGAVVESTRLANPPLASGASAERSFDFGGNATEGMYLVKIYMNAEGVDPGSGVPGAQGLRGYIGAQFVVGQNDIEADQQNRQAWITGTQTLTMAATLWPPAEAILSLAEAVNWLVAVDSLTAEERGELEKVALWCTTTPLAAERDPTEAFTQFREQLQSIGGAAMGSVQASTPDERKHVIDALAKLSRGIESV